MLRWVSISEGIIIALSITRIYLITKVTKLMRRTFTDNFFTSLDQIRTILAHYWAGSGPSILKAHFQPIEFNNLNHEAAFRNITALIFVAATIISGLTNCFFYTKNEGWFVSITITIIDINIIIIITNCFFYTKNEGWFFSSLRQELFLLCCSFTGRSFKLA